MTRDGPRLARSGPRWRCTASRISTIISDELIDVDPLRCGAPFVKSRRIWLMMSAAASVFDDSRRRARLVKVRRFAIEPERHALASVMAAAIGWFTSCAREAVNSPMVVTRLT
jgi:hypothetical protein